MHFSSFNLISANADISLCSTERAILIILKDLVHPTKHCAFPTQGYIAKILGITTRWVRKCLKHLRELGYLDQLYRNKNKVVAWSVSLVRKWKDDVRPVLAMRPFIKAIKRLAKPRQADTHAEQEFLQSNTSITRQEGSAPLGGVHPPQDVRKELNWLIDQYLDAQNLEEMETEWMFYVPMDSIKLLKDALATGKTLEEL